MLSTKNTGARKSPNPNKKSSSKKKKNGSEPSTLVRAPAAAGNVRTMSKAKVVSAANGDTRIRHREYLTDLTYSSDFSIPAGASLSINPGILATFPWLSAIANRFESYRFNSLKFIAETMVGTTVPGSVMMAVDFDANDTAPNSKLQMMAYRNASRTPTWADCEYVCATEDLNKLKTHFVRNGSLGANQDVKLYDVGRFFIAGQGVSPSTTTHELYVEYDVTLMTPQLQDIGSGDSVSGQLAGTVNTAPFGTKTGAVPISVSSSGDTTSISTLTFTQPWEGLLGVRLVGTGLAGVVATGTAASSVSGDVINAAATNETCRIVVRAVTGSTLILTVTNTTITTGNILCGQGDFL